LTVNVIMALPPAATASIKQLNRSPANGCHTGELARTATPASLGAVVGMAITEAVPAEAVHSLLTGKFTGNFGKLEPDHR
jgi:hypothetical protein